MNVAVMTRRIALQGASDTDHSGQGSPRTMVDDANKANGPADCLVTEILQCLEVWKILRLIFLKKNQTPGLKRALVASVRSHL